MKLKTTSPIKLIGVMTTPSKIAPNGVISRKSEIRTKKTGVRIMAPELPPNACENYFLQPFGKLRLARGSRKIPTLFFKPS